MIILVKSNSEPSTYRLTIPGRAATFAICFVADGRNAVSNVTSVIEGRWIGKDQE